MSEEQAETKDYPQLLRHFQSINASNVTNAANIILTLTVGVTAFAVNILVTARGPLGACAAGCLIASFALLFGAALTGVLALFSRIEDYRITIRAIVLERDNPGEITDQQLLLQASAIKRKADRINKATNILIYIQPSLFLLGFICLAISVLITHRANLK